MTDDLTNLSHMHAPRPRPRFRAAAVASLIHDRRGAAAVELALVAPLLALILAGLADGARLIGLSMRLNAAAAAGAEYAQGHAWSDAGVVAAARDGVDLAPTPTLATRQVLGCVSQGKIVETTATRCADGHAAGRYAIVTASAPFKPIAPWPGVSQPKALSATAELRIP